MFGVADLDAFGVFGRVVVGSGMVSPVLVVVAAMSSTIVRMEVGLASPVESDEAEHAVFDLVPFRGAGRVVAYGDGQAGFGGQSNEVGLPGSNAGIRWSRRRHR